MTEKEMKDRTKAFALRTLKPVDTLPHTRSGRVLSGQLGRSGTSVGESAFGMELITDHGLLPALKVAPLLKEADGLTAIMVASRRTMQAGNRGPRIQNRK